MGENLALAKEKKVYTYKDKFWKIKKIVYHTELVPHCDVYKFWLISVFVTNAKGEIVDIKSSLLLVTKII